MKAEKFDFRRLFDEWDDALVGKRCIIADHIDEILEAVENGIDESEVMSPRGRDASLGGFLPFWSEEQEDYFSYAYVLDEDFVEKPLAQVRKADGNQREMARASSTGHNCVPGL